MIYKYETHLHTFEASKCAASKATDMVDYYKNSGYAGFVVTDHFFNGNTSISHNLPWEERVSLYCEGYKNAKRYGDAVDFDVFFGIEYNFKGTEFLFYGLSENWLLKNWDITEIPLKTALIRVRESGGFIIHAHPFRQAPYISMIRLIPELTDAVEGYNGGNLYRDSIQNNRAIAYASMFNLPVTSGTDIHSISDRIHGGISSKYRFESIFDMTEAIKTGEYNILWE
jgi:predicted metal-dependent phosphoesterase TrpH